MSPDRDPILQARGLTRSFGAITAANSVDLDLFPGETHALIGPNGAGKTTLINLIGGELRPDAGCIYLKGQDITRLPVHKRANMGLARTFQITNIFHHLSVVGNVALAVQSSQGHSFRFWQPAGSAASLREPALEYLREVGLEEDPDRPAAELSHGDQRKVAVAMTLALEPSVLLLDEPLAGMGPSSSAELIRTLDRLWGKHSILLVEHDMDAVFRLADRVSVLVYGSIIASGSPDEIRRHPDVREAYLGEEGAIC